MATDCKSVGFPFGGSNPPLPTNKTDVFLHIRFVVCFGGENHLWFGRHMTGFLDGLRSARVSLRSRVWLHPPLKVFNFILV